MLDRLLEAGAAVCVVLAGGYADDVRDTVDINAATAAAVAGRTHVLDPRLGDFRNKGFPHACGVFTLEERASKGSGRSASRPSLAGGPYGR